MNSLACLAVTQPAKALMAEKAASSFHFTRSSGYDRGDAEQLKAEQSVTTDLPLQALSIEMRTGMGECVEGSEFQSPFANSPALHLKRTARALAAIQPQTKSEQAATIGCLPFAGAHLAFGASRPALSSIAPRRRLLPPAKTTILPQGDPVELRSIVQEMQQKRSQAAEIAQSPHRLSLVEECSMTARYPAFTFAALAQPAAPEQALTPSPRRTPSLTRAFRCVGRLLGDLIDKLAVA